jgi:cytochrome c-type biogenesis protein CcmH/NrfG
MRLALVERYLVKGDLEGAVRHADVALGLATEPADRQRALKLSGWLTAIGGEPAKGADLLTQSLDLQPSDLDTQWFLANVRLTGLDDPAGAATILEGMLEREIPADKRKVIEAKLAEARSGG